MRFLTERGIVQSKFHARAGIADEQTETVFLFSGLA
jgi:hypothetical protein